jgi:uncharacterized OB-fold protein
MVYAADEIAVKKCRKPVWVNGLASVSDEENQFQSENYGGIGVLDPSEQMGCRLSAKKAYAMANIKNPAKEIDMAEIYAPFPSQEMLFAEKLGLFDEGTAWQHMENGETEIEGPMPICPSGGVNCTNAIGSSALQRMLEGALQIMGKAEEHQVPKQVHNVMTHGWGGNTNLMGYLKDKRPETMMVNGRWEFGSARYKAHGLLQEFVDALKERKLLGSLCKSCGKVIVPPRLVCGGCHEYMEGRQIVSNTGTVTCFLISPPVEKGKFTMFGMDPIATGVLKEGEILIPVFIQFDGSNSNIALVLNDVKPEDVRIGMRVKVVWAEKTQGHLSDIEGVVPLDSE